MRQASFGVIVWKFPNLKVITDIRCCDRWELSLQCSTDDGRGGCHATAQLCSIYPWLASNDRIWSHDCSHLGAPQHCLQQHPGWRETEELCAVTDGLMTPRQAVSPQHTGNYLNRLLPSNLVETSLWYFYFFVHSLVIFALDFRSWQSCLVVKVSWQSFDDLH